MSLQDGRLHPQTIKSYFFFGSPEALKLNQDVKLLCKVSFPLKELWWDQSFWWAEFEQTLQARSETCPVWPRPQTCPLFLFFFHFCFLSVETRGTELVRARTLESWHCGADPARLSRTEPRLDSETVTVDWWWCQRHNGGQSWKTYSCKTLWVTERGLKWGRLDRPAFFHQETCFIQRLNPPRTSHQQRSSRSRFFRFLRICLVCRLRVSFNFAEKTDAWFLYSLISLRIRFTGAGTGSLWICSEDFQFHGR